MREHCMTDRLERLINLVIALRETRRPLPAEEIRRRVAGYGQGEYESFRRMFERDKADLRSLGVPIETMEAPTGDDIEGYRIDPKKYDLPPVTFPPEELTALALAVQATGLMDSALMGLRKLQVGQGATGGVFGESEGRDPNQRRPRADARLDVEDPNRMILTEAQISRTRVRFTYRRSDGDESVRTVEPHALIFRRGRWYVTGWDHERQARRSFRLDRIIGVVKTSGKARVFEPPKDEVDPGAVVPEREAVAATVAIPEELAWTVASRSRGEGRLLGDGRVAYQVVADRDAIMAWVFDQAPELEVVAPQELRADILARLDPSMTRGSPL